MKYKIQLFLLTIVFLLTMLICILGDKVFAGTWGNITFSGTDDELGDNYWISFLDGTYDGVGKPRFDYETNKNIYCLQMGTDAAEKDFYVETLVKIVDNKITYAKGKKKDSSVVDLYTEYSIGNKQTSAAMDENAKLAKIIELADANASSRSRRDGSDDDDHAASSLMNMRKDPYQWLIWREFNEWMNNSICLDQTTANITAIKSYFVSSTSWSSDKTGSGKSDADSIWNKTISNYKASSETPSISFATNKETGEFVQDDAVLQGYDTTVISNTTYAILGPFYMNYGGTISEFNVSVSGDKKLDISNTLKIGTYTGDSETFKTISVAEISKGGTIFYIATEEKNLVGKNKLEISVKVKGKSVTTVLAVLRHEDGAQRYLVTTQNKQDKTDDAKCTYKLELPREVTFQKQDENGKNLKIQGIEFQIYKSTSSGNYVTILTTDENGETETIKLVQGEKYTVKETINNEYGYKNATVSDAEFISGAGEITNISNNTFEITITKDSVIGIENKPELGDLIIAKEGEKDTLLEGVEFAIQQSGGDKDGYMKFETVENGKASIDAKTCKITIVDSLEEATKFKTDSNGKIEIKNLEIYSGVSKKFNYWIYEVSNENYGYKKVNITKPTINSGEILTVSETVRNRFVKINISKESILTIPNPKELGNLEIEKVGIDQTKLEDVQFKIKIGKDKYLQLENASKKFENSIKGTVTIDPDNIADSKYYKVNYVTNEADATTFITDSNGKVNIINLEVNKSNSEKYTYTAEEIDNPNYGYGSIVNTQLTESISVLKLNETNQLEFTNTKKLGNLNVIKHDEQFPNVVLPNVGFKIEIISGEKNETKYLALYKQDGSLQKESKGTTTINSENTATLEEYSIDYVKNKDNATIFVTGDDGILTIKNLEVYSRETGAVYKYRLTEELNPNEGYEEKPIQSEIVTLEKEEPVYIKISNPLKYTKISGYVWIEKPAGKGDEYDGIYEPTGENPDIKLTDLYITDGDGKLKPNDKAEIPVKIQLHDADNNVIKDRPDKFETDGKYTFTDVEIENLGKYKVVFVYDGLYYTTVVTPENNLSKPECSKVKEVADERTNLNNKFATVQDTDSYEKYDDNQNDLISRDGTTNKINYVDGTDSKGNKISEVTGVYNSTGGSITQITANTEVAGYNLGIEYKKLIDNLPTNTTKIVDGIDNVNMGIVLREQPSLSITSDIHSVIVDINESSYTYYYEGRTLNEVNLLNNEVGAKFELENGQTRYSRTVYTSDIDALVKGNASMEVSIIYQIAIENESNTLSSEIHEIVNYFDDDYEVTAIGFGIKEENGKKRLDEDAELLETIKGKDYVVKDKDGNDTGYNAVNIPVGFKLDSERNKVKNVYIKFSVKEQAIKGLFDEQSLYHNATEIRSYTTKYGTNTGKAKWLNQEKIVNVITETETNNKRTGQIYAGIDRYSELGNIKLELVDDPRDGETKVLNTKEFEFDTTSAPAFLLQATQSRTISGTIFEDTDCTGEDDNIKLGNGIFDSTEKTIEGVEITLHEVVNGKPKSQVAKYSNGEDARATTDGEGNYTFGEYDDVNKKFIGVMPGKYVIKFAYNNETYIVPNVENNINVMDYKSTIIKSDNVKKAFLAEDKGETSDEKWYLADEDNRYSDARDDIDNFRKEFELESDFTINNSTYKSKLSVDHVEAFTPIMDIGVEFTEENEANVVTIDFTKIRELKNIDFGIIERPDIDITIQKDITNIEIIAQNGTTIIRGNPSDINSIMQGVKVGLEEIVPAEIDKDLLHGAQLNLEYTITLFNNSDIDYLEKPYYYYGIEGGTEVTAKAKTVVDYLDSTMTLDVDKNAKWNWAEKGVNDLTGLVDDDIIENVLKGGEYHILTTEAFSTVDTGGSEEVKLYATKVLAKSDNIREENKVEIIELIGTRTIKDSIPGNYDPSKSPNDPGYRDELDDGRVDLVITPPTGTSINYVLYIVAVAGTLAILVIGIIILKRKVIS